ncbi:MAG: hypothetical protein RR539_04455 [Clostridium sp.]|uniref:hypothetical protein n=1 Tax=Clostridium sp. TaxID=1506 RepID=UPI002FC6C34A
MFAGLVLGLLIHTTKLFSPLYNLHLSFSLYGNEDETGLEYPPDTFSYFFLDGEYLKILY